MILHEWPRDADPPDLAVVKRIVDEEIASIVAAGLESSGDLRRTLFIARVIARVRAA